MKKIFRSEDGAAYVLEAAIIFPIVFLVVMWLGFMGFLYAQKSYLQYWATEISAYIAKTIVYPGYASLDPRFAFEEPGGGKSELDRVTKAVEQVDPYRYLFGLFKGDYITTDEPQGRSVPEEMKNYMMNEIYGKRGFVRSSGGSVGIDDDPYTTASANSNGYFVGIHATTSRVTVCLAENYAFPDFFRMIGIGGAKTVISGTGETFVNDSVEFVRLSDLAFDAVDFLAGKLGIDLDDIGEKIRKFINPS